MEVTNWGGHLGRALEDLFNDRAFLEEVVQFRLKNKIPKLGFADNRRYHAYKKIKARGKAVDALALKMARARKLPRPYVQWIDAFIGLGFDCTEYVIPFASGERIPGHAYDMETVKDSVVFRFYKGGTQNDFIKFIRARWFLVKGFLEISTLDEKAPAVRKKSESKKERDKKIYELHLNGFLRSDGSWKDIDVEQPNFSSNLSREQKRKIINAEKRLARITNKYKRLAK